LVFLVDYFLLAFQPISYMYISLIFAVWPVHLIILDLIILIILSDEYKFWSALLCNFLQPPVTLSFSGWNILLSTLFSNALSLCSSVSVRDQVLHPYRNRGKIMVQHILIFTFSDSRWEESILEHIVASITQIKSPLNFLLNTFFYLLL
jgi:hypothetical protein